MPHITLDLVSLDNKPLVGLSRRFEGTGGTIGRDEGNTLSLPDSHRRVSRLHASITFPDGVPTITNSSSVLPIGVGGMELKCGQALPLVPGMNLDIGPYVLAVRRAEAATEPVAEPAAAPIEAPVQAPVAVAAAAPVAVAAAAPVPAAAPFVPPPVHFPAPLPSTGDPFADLLAGAVPAPAAAGLPMPAARSGSVDDPLAGLLGTPAAPAMLPPGAPSARPADDAGFLAGLGIQSPAAIPEPVLPPLDSPMAAMPSPPPAPAVIIPEDFNPFDLPSASGRNSADPLASLLGGAAAPAGQHLTHEEPSIDSIFAPAGASIDAGLPGDPASVDPLLMGQPSRGPMALLGQPDSSDPLALFGDAPAGREGFMQPMRDDLAEIGGAYQPPRAIEPVLARPPAVQPAPAPVAAAASTAPQTPMPSYPEDALTRAFLSGAGLTPAALPNGLTPEIMTMVGSLLRSATGGAIEMLAIRANIKREVQASVTIISTEANNPLKFLPDAESVLHQMLGKKMPGFMRPDEAMKDAFNDLRAHEMGVIAGTRAALDEVLTKFDPALLGDRLVSGSLLEKALPAMRKTKLWDLYLERYALLRQEVEDDFQSVFGKAFVAAYESEAARMKARDPGRKS